MKYALVDKQKIKILDRRLRMRLDDKLKSGGLNAILDAFHAATPIFRGESAFRLSLRSRVFLLSTKPPLNAVVKWANALAQIDIAGHCQPRDVIFAQYDFGPKNVCPVCSGTGLDPASHGKLRHPLRHARFEKKLKSILTVSINKGALRDVLLAGKESIREKGIHHAYAYELVSRAEYFKKNHLIKITLLNKSLGFYVNEIKETPYSNLEPLMTPLSPCQHCQGSGFW